MRSVKGFTVVELMVVIAIVGVLAAIALPAYQDYTIRTRMAEVLTIAGSLKTQVGECILVHNAITPCDGGASGIAANDVINTTDYIWGLDIDEGRIAMKLSGGDLTGKSWDAWSTDVPWLIFSPTVNTQGGVQWSCGVTNTFVFRFVPLECRTLVAEP